MPLCNHLSLNVPGPGDLHLMNGMWQRLWDATSEVKLKKTVTSVLLATPYFWLFSGAYLDAKATWQRTKWHLANSQRPQCLRGTESCQQPHELASNLPSQISRGSQLQLTPWLKPGRGPESGSPGEPHLQPWKPKDNKRCFKLLIFVQFVKQQQICGIKLFPSGVSPSVPCISFSASILTPHATNHSSSICVLSTSAYLDWKRQWQYKI